MGKERSWTSAERGGAGLVRGGVELDWCGEGWSWTSAGKESLGCGLCCLLVVDITATDGDKCIMNGWVMSTSVKILLTFWPCDS